MIARFLSLILHLAAASLLAVPALADGKRVALVIGNAAYKHAAELHTPRNDAQDVAAALEKLGFTVISEFDLDWTSMRRAIDRFSQALEGANVGVFFYAGHGIQLNGASYLMPTDSRLESQQSSEFELIPFASVQRVMGSRPRTNILFLDASRENPLARNLARAMGTRAKSIQPGLSRAEADIGTIISFSTQPDNVAAEGTERNSPYSRALVRQLMQPSLPIFDMLLNVRRDVMLATQGRQIPWEHSALTDRFYFSEPGTVLKAQAIPASPANPRDATPAMPPAPATAATGTDRRDAPIGGGVQKKHAFVVGIDRYDNLPAHAQLMKAVGDSREMATTLAALGFMVTTVKEPTRGEFVAKWHQFLEDVRPGDTLAFVFSGHGVEIEGSNYLLMRDVPRVRSGREGQLRSESMSFGQILTDVRERKPVFSFVVLDACRDNPFEEGGRSVGGRRGLGRVEAPEGAFVMYSAGAGQKALDRLDDADKAQTSVFTRTLLPLMRTPGLSLLDMADQVGEQVRSLALSTGYHQAPAFYSNVIGGRRVCLAGCEVPPAPVSSSGAAETVRVCREVEQVTSLTTLGVLELQHKGTPAGDCIAARIGELKAAQTEAVAEAERKRVALLSKPNPPELLDRTALARRINRELKRVGCDPGTSGDTWPVASQEALQQFAEATKHALFTDEPTQAALDALTTQKIIACPVRPAALSRVPEKPVQPPIAATPPPAIVAPAAPPTPVATTPPPKFVAPPAMTEPAATTPPAADVSPPATAVAPVVVAPTPPAIPPAAATPPPAASPPKTAPRAIPRAAAVKPSPLQPVAPAAPQPAPFATSVQRDNTCRIETVEECLKRIGHQNTSHPLSLCPVAARKEICPGSRPAAARPTPARTVEREKKCRAETVEECIARTGFPPGSAFSQCPRREICR